MEDVIQYDTTNQFTLLLRLTN